MKEPPVFQVRRIHLLVPAVLLALCWLGLLWTRGGLSTAADSLEKLGAVLFFCFSCMALGSLAVRGGELSGEKILLSLTTGFILLYAGVFVLGALHLTSRPLLVFLCYAPGIPLLLRAPIARIGSFLSEKITLDGVEVLLWVVASMVWFYCFLCSLSPVTYYDALANHIGIPAEYLVRGGIERIPYNLHADLPPAAHLIYLPLLAGPGGDAVQLLGPVLFLFVALSFRSVAGTAVAWLSAWILFMLIPQVSLLFSLANIDFLTTLFCLVSLILYFRARNDSRAGNWMLLAAHLAFLVSLKYQAAIFAGLLLLIALVQRPRQAVLACILFGCFLLPFLVKNYLFAGDPVFPFLTGSFHLPEDVQAQARFFVNANRHMDAPSAINYASAFVRAFTGWPEAGLLPLVILLAAVCFRKIESSFRFILLLFSLVPVAIHIFFSLNLVNLMRWIQYSWACLCLLAGLSLGFLFRRSRLWIAGLVVYCLISFYVCYLFNLRLTESILVGTGRMTAEQYKNRYIPSYGMRSRMESLEGRILFLGDARGYYNVENSIIPSDYNFLYYKRYFDGARDASDLAANLRKDSIRYLFLSEKGIAIGLKNGRHSWLAGKNLAILQELVRKYPVVDQDGISILVRLNQP